MSSRACGIFKHVFGLVTIYFTPGLFQWLRAFLIFGLGIKSSGLCTLLSIQKSLLFSDNSFMRKWRTQCSWLEVFLLVSLKPITNLSSEVLVALTVCTRKHSSIFPGDLPQLALVNTKNPAQELTHHLFSVQTTTCPCFPGRLSLWVWHTKVVGFPLALWLKKKTGFFKNMNVSSIWSENSKREGGVFLSLWNTIPVKWDKKKKEKKSDNETLLSIPLASRLHCNSLKHIWESEVNLVTLSVFSWVYQETGVFRFNGLCDYSGLQKESQADADKSSRDGCAPNKRLSARD